MSTQTEAPAFGTPGWTPEQLNEVRDQMAPPPVATGPAQADLNAKAAAGIPTIADVEAMMATMQEQMEARLQARHPAPRHDGEQQAGADAAPR